MMEKSVQTLSETKLFAERVVVALKGAAYYADRAVVLTLSGPLGAGKTAFVKCLAEILGVSGDVTSPSFVLRSDYDTTDEIFTRLVHIDAYRLDVSSEIETVGWQDVLATSHSLVAVEWPERIVGYIPDNVCSVSVRFRGAARVFSAHLPVTNTV